MCTTMNEEIYKRILDKYLEGEASLEEEDQLLQNSNLGDSSLQDWFAFVSKNRHPAPVGFNDYLWDSFESKINRRSNRWKWTIIIVACICLLIVVATIFSVQDKQSYAMKEQRLNEALAMFQNYDQKEVAHDVLYENEMIVLYMETEYLGDPE